MRHLVTNKKVIIYGFVLMNNHIHLLWQMRAGIKRDAVQRDFLKHTAREIKNDMLDNHKDELQQYLVNAKDRKYPRLTGRAGILGKKCFIGRDMD